MTDGNGGSCAGPAATTTGYDLLFELSQDMLSVMALDGTILRANPAFERQLRHAASHLARGNLGEIVHPDDAGLLAGLIRRLQAGEPSGTAELRLRSAPDRYRWIEVNSTAKDGLVYSIARDITDRKSLDMLVECEQAVLRAIIDGQPLRDTLALICGGIEAIVECATCTVLLVGPDGRLRPAAGADHGRLDEHGLPIVEGGCASGTAAFRRAPVLIEDTATDPLMKGYEHLVEEVGVRSVWAAPILSRDETVLGTFAIHRRELSPSFAAEVRPIDRLISSAAVAIERSRLDSELVAAMRRAESANRAKSEFIAHMSHEFRTPLNAIIGFAELAEAEVYGPLGHDRYREYAQDIRVAGQHLLALINEVLDVARIEGGNVRIEPEPIALHAFVDERFRTIDLAFSTRPNFHNAISPLCPMLRGDPRALTQILLNLLGNAVKFTPVGGTVTIDADATAPGLRLAIRDTGIGIAADVLDRIGERFYRAGNELYGDNSGTGLGIYISRSLMSAHGGTLAIDSAPNIGTVVTLAFPEKAVIREAAALSADA